MFIYKLREGEGGRDSEKERVKERWIIHQSMQIDVRNGQMTTTEHNIVHYHRIGSSCTTQTSFTPSRPHRQIHKTTNKHTEHQTAPHKRTQTDEHRDKQTDKLTEKLTDKQTNKQTNN